jgi:hypothetical protein
MKMTILYEFMVTFDMPKELDGEFVSVIPSQRAVINKLMKEGVVTSYALSLENSKLWIIMIAETELEVVQIVSGFPIINKVEFNISKLAFHNNANRLVPNFSEN